MNTDSRAWRETLRKRVRQRGDHGTDMARNTSSSAARFSKRFTQAQKDAILRAVLVNGETVANAIRKANTGQLDVPAFKIGRYGYDIVREGREGFEERDETALDRALERELKATATAALAHNRALLASFKRDGSGDPDALRRSAQALAAIKRSRKDTGASKPQAPTTPQSQPERDTGTYTPVAPDVLAQLIDTVPANGKRKGGGPVRSPAR